MELKDWLIMAGVMLQYAVIWATAMYAFKLAYERWKTRNDHKHDWGLWAVVHINVDDGPDGGYYVYQQRQCRSCGFTETHQF